MRVVSSTVDLIQFAFDPLGVRRDYLYAISKVNGNVFPIGVIM